MSKSLKTGLYLFLFGLATVYALLFRGPTKTTYAPGEIKGSHTNLELFVEPEAGRAPILKATDSAQSEVLVEVYLLSDKEIISSLINAKNRGADVKIMLEKNPFGGGNLNDTTTQNLTDAGVSVRWTNPIFALTHEKSIIVDQNQAFILNQNLTQSAFTKNREYDIIDTNPGDVAEVRNIFQADWNRTSYSPTTPDLVISPDNARGKLTALLNSAAKSLDLEVEVIDDNSVVNTLSAKAKTLPVRLILPDAKRIPANATAITTLGSTGVQIKTLSSPYPHAKLIIVDNRKAYLGSVNLTTASLDQNRELGILISQTDIIQTLGETFSSDWEKAQTP